jgi:hypothetical protein
MVISLGLQREAMDQPWPLGTIGGGCKGKVLKVLFFLDSIDWNKYCGVIAYLLCVGLF